MDRLSRGPAGFLALALVAGCAGGRPADVRSGPSAHGASGGDPATTAPTPLYGNLGPHSRPIVTSSDRAQAYFDDGLLFMYAFGTGSALESFRAARDEDPGCAACWWGEAWALSPYLNGGMGADAERRAYDAIREAETRAGRASEVEGALIEAFTVRYEAEPTPERRKALDSLYARRMGEVAERFPDDLDVQTLWAEALMLLRPRRGSVDLDAPDVRRILPILEGVLARDIRHPGACHLYIHLVEASSEPVRGEACADHLGDAIAVSHVRHMPSHVYMNIGRYGDAVRGNQRAWHADQMAAHGGPPGVYPSHNLHMLLSAAVLDGQSAVAIQAARDLAREQPAWAWYVPVTLSIFGRWTEVLELGTEPEDPFQGAMWRYARGMAHLRTGDPAAAAADLARLDEIRAALPPDGRFRFHDQATLLGLPRGILAAEIARAAGRDDEALALLEDAIAVEDGLVYDEPEPWHLPARHVLGAILLDMDRAKRAEIVYREALEDHPGSGWALFGLARALDAQGKRTEARETRVAFQQAFGRADIWLRASRF